jgi:SAM-dependent methyltransferase
LFTIDFKRFPVGSGQSVLDVGCGSGRHAFQAFKLGADVVALDTDAEEVDAVSQMFAAMLAEGQVPTGARAEAIQGSAYALPFGDATFDKIIASEILEHLPDDVVAIDELYRVLKPGGQLAISVPRWLPESVCWALSSEYHEVEGGHVRIYRGNVLRDRLTASGFEHIGNHYAHSLHSPYWWLKCAVGVNDDDHWLVSAYHKMLVWDMMSAPAITRKSEQILNPLLGKSLVLYLSKPAVVSSNAAA